MLPFVSSITVDLLDLLPVRVLVILQMVPVSPLSAVNSSLLHSFPCTPLSLPLPLSAMSYRECFVIHSFLCFVCHHIVVLFVLPSKRSESAWGLSYVERLYHKRLVHSPSSSLQSVLICNFTHLHSHACFISFVSCDHLSIHVSHDYQDVISLYPVNPFL